MEDHFRIHLLGIDADTIIKVFGLIALQPNPFTRHDYILQPSFFRCGSHLIKVYKRPTMGGEAKLFIIRNYRESLKSTSTFSDFNPQTTRFSGGIRIFPSANLRIYRKFGH